MDGWMDVATMSHVIATSFLGVVLVEQDLGQPKGLVNVGNLDRGSPSDLYSSPGQSVNDQSSPGDRFYSTRSYYTADLGSGITLTFVETVPDAGARLSVEVIA